MGDSSPYLTIATLTREGRRVAANRRDLHAVIAYACHIDDGVRTLWSWPDDKQDTIIIQSAEPPRADQLATVATVQHVAY